MKKGQKKMKFFAGKKAVFFKGKVYPSGTEVPGFSDEYRGNKEAVESQIERGLIRVEEGRAAKKDDI